MLRVLLFAYTLHCCVGVCLGISPEEGKELYKRAQAGNAEAQFELGGCFARGDGVKMDAVQAKQWLGKAIAQGHGGAKAALRDLLRDEKVKGKVEAKVVSPEEAKALGLQLTGILYSDANYDVEKVMGNVEGGYTNTRRLKDREWECLVLLLPGRMLKAEPMQRVKKLVADGASLSVSIDAEAYPYKVCANTQRGASAMSCAIINKDWAVMRFLLANGGMVEIDASTSYAIKRLFYFMAWGRRNLSSRCMYQDSLITLRKLVELGFEPNDVFLDTGQSLMYYAAAYNAPDALKYLIRAGGNVSIQGNKDKCLYPKDEQVLAMLNDTPMMVTLRKGHKEAMKELLAANPDLNVKNAQGKTLLDIKDDLLDDARASESFRQVKSTLDALEAVFAKMGAKRAKDL